ncbi:MAG: hypothetical protein NT011_03295 [Kiritimatiellaeota bacterium]|nr:hypothetical protein [Kiritimatiellota bacterium]
MIWNPPAADEHTEQALAAYIANEIEPAVEDSQATATAYRHELAEAVAAFIRRQHPAFAASSPDGALSRNEGLPAEYLLLLIGRALWSVGEEQAARRLLEIKGHALNLPATFIEAVLAPDISMLHWHILLSTRAVRTSSLMRSLNGTLWVLDLERMVLPASTSLELLALNVVRTVIDRVAVLWDHCQGRGLLGLRHANTVAAGMLGCPRHSAKSMALAADIRDLCTRRLQTLKTDRGWDETPQVIMLDL